MFASLTFQCFAFLKLCVSLSCRDSNTNMDIKEPHAEYLKIPVKMEGHQLGLDYGYFVKQYVACVSRRIVGIRSDCWTQSSAETHCVQAAFTLCLSSFLLVGLCPHVHCTTNLITFSSLHHDPLGSAG